LAARGLRTVLATDHRVESYGADFPAAETHVIPSATLAGRSPVAMAKTGVTLASGVRKAHALLGRIKPAVVVGFGGYPSFPPLVAAAMRRIPTALHEQNAVLGRANAMLAKRVTRVATSFPDVAGTEALPEGRVLLTGNPVRSRVLAAAATPYAPHDAAGKFRLVVFGGSQGARYFSETMPDAIAALPADLRARLSLIQQCRPEDLEAVTARYDVLGVDADCAPFFDDLPRLIADSQLVVARSGASTVAELCVLGRPSILVPLPHALDNDQLRNARTLVDAGAAASYPQSDLTPDVLANVIAQLLSSSERLSSAADAAAALGRPDAAERLADCVEALADK
ncbi:MAG: UDP-N-acetylglucosamine--N-acetylmuramyl-(pentapeptide) pyrophosphoryl-undecaprenol N-acetylglucosamine transferase, partial [Pseudomonadota bacterium]